MTRLDFGYWYLVFGYFTGQAGKWNPIRKDRLGRRVMSAMIAFGLRQDQFML